jgi:uncharacterized membrane protein YeiH
MDTVFFVFELIGVVAFALSGAMRAMKCDMDVFGVCVLAVTTALGGGFMRDCLIGNTPPINLLNPFPATLSIAIAIFAFLPFMRRLLFHTTKAHELLMLIADSIGLGVFTVTGVSICFSHFEAPQLFMTVFLGAITGVGGGVLRDVLSRRTPYIFVKHFYASASIIGAAVSALLFPYVGQLIAMIIGIVLIVSLRFMDAAFHWHLPKADELSFEE